LRPNKAQLHPEIEELLGGQTADFPFPETVSADVLADILGVTARMVNELTRRGVISRAGPGAYAVRPSIRNYCDGLREKAAGRGGSANLTAERTRVAREQADALKIKNAALRRELVPARDVEAAWAIVLRDVRAAMLAIPNRIQQRLGHFTPLDVAAVDREIRDVLAETGHGG
jgi:phage terminase Nu1 subunit (DNA packaging protein)